MDTNKIEIEGVPEHILRRLQGAFNKANSAREIGSLAEAESAMLYIQKVLAEYNLEMSQISDTRQKSVIGEIKVSYDGKVSYGEWETDLMSFICHYNWCSMIYNSRRKDITVIGRADNVGVCIYLYNFIRINLIMLSKVSYYTEMGEWNEKLSEHYGYNVGDHLGKGFEEYLNKNKYMPYRRYYIRDYLAGAVQGIGTKFELQQQEQKKGAGMMDLILSNQDEIKDYIASAYPNLTTSVSKEVFDSVFLLCFLTCF